MLEGWRHAVDGGWFSWDLKVLAAGPQELRVKYWGGDSGREFDVFVDGAKLATQKLERNKPNQLYEGVYPIPDACVRGKTNVTVRFQGHPGKIAGGVFGCAVATHDTASGVKP